MPAPDPDPAPDPASNPAGGGPLDVHRMLAELRSQDPGRPRVTWYGPDGERVELSASVLQNWVAKTANLLVEEFDAGPGTRIGVALPAHWRTVIWLLGIWSAGGCAVLPADGVAPPAGQSGLDVLVTDHPPPASRPAVVAVPLPALAASFGAGLPAGALDGAIEVRRQADTFAPLHPPAGADPALDRPEGVLTYEQLRSAASGAAPPGVRLLTGAGPEQAVTHWLAPLLAGGSLVLHHALDRLPADDRDRLCTQEGVSAG